MSVASQIKQITVDMLADILDEVPSDTELMVAVTAIGWLSDKYILNWYRRVIGPHAAKVKARDVAFFKSQATTDNRDPDATAVFSIIARLWDTIGTPAQNKIWARMAVIMRLVGAA